MAADPDSTLLPALESLWPGGGRGAQLTPLPAQASGRRYTRASVPGASPESAVAMQLPEEVLPVVDELPFLNVARFLARRGVRVPRIYVQDLARGVVLLEDLGDETFGARLEATPQQEWGPLYGQAIDTLAGLHAAFAEPEPGCVAFERAFDRTLLRWELDHFRQWGLEAVVGPLPKPARAALDAELDALTERLLAHPQAVAHRDYQSRNLMWVDDGLCVIDFQDALLGPEAYDLVALLCDSYVTLEEPFQRAMLDRYAAARELTEDARSRLEAGFWEVAVQRKLKDAGRFVFLDRQRRQPEFLPFYAPTLQLVGRALGRSGLTDLDRLLRELLPGFPDAVATPSATS